MSGCTTSRLHTIILIAIVAWSAVLRLWQCDSALPGMHVDEASNAWNASCLLHTGQDEWGQRWPIFYTRAFDDYRSPLHLYLLLPLQAAGGMNVCTTRLPAAIGGVLTVLLVWSIGRRIFDSASGLVAAAFVAISPWHIQHTRWGHEGSITPLLFAAAVAAMLFAGVPCVDRPARPRVWAGLLAGMITGLACYGYGAVRLVIPATILLAFAAAARCWIRFFADRATRRTALAITAGLMVMLVPLVWTHLTDPHINRRARITLAGDADHAAHQRFLRGLSRYPAHFGPRFLFTQGSSHPALSPPPGYGALHWYMLPLLAAGAAVLIVRARRSMSARLALAMLLAFPAGDLFFGDTDEPHPLRSFAGLIPLALVAAAGARFIFDYINRLRRPWPLVAAGTAAAVVVGPHVMFLHVFFGSFTDSVAKYWQRNVDLMQACQIIRPHVNSADAVFCTRELLLYPHVLMLVFLEHDPHRWFAEPREYLPGPAELGSEVVCSRFGKFYLMYDTTASSKELAQLGGNDRRDRVLMIVRPGQRPASPAPVASIEKDGLVWLYIYDFEI